MTGSSQTKALAAVRSLYAPVSNLKTIPDLLTLNATFYSTLYSSNVFSTSPAILKQLTSVDLTIQILRYVNLDNYAPDLGKMSGFWVNYGTVYLTNTDLAFLSKISNTLNQNQVDAFCAAFIPPASVADQNA